MGGGRAGGFTATSYQLPQPLGAQPRFSPISDKKVTSFRPLECYPFKSAILLLYSKGGHMNWLLIGSVAIANIVLAAPAFAADMPLKAPPSIPPPSAHDWNGCYFGGNVGGNWLHTSGSVDLGPLSPITSVPTSFDMTGGNTGSFIGGGQLGCNYQINQFVLGLEGDADWQHLNRTGTLALTTTPIVFDSASGSVNVTSNWQSSLRARFGFAAGNSLWYATGGVSFTRVNFSGQGAFAFPGSISPIPIPPSIDPFYLVSVSKTLVGGTAGLGFEYALGPQLTIGLEGRYTWYGSQRFNTVVTDPAVAVGNMNMNSSEITGRVNYKFSDNEQSRERR